MTVSSTTRKAGPFLGNDSTTAFPFTFKLFATSDLQLTHIDADGDEVVLVLDSDYSIALNADQDNDPGGTITYPLTGDPLATGEQLVGLGSLVTQQGTDLTNLGRFLPQVIENAFDYAIILIQQLEERVGRALLVPAAETAGGNVPAADDRAGMFLAFDASGNPVASSGTGADAALRTDLAADGGALLVADTTMRVGTVAELRALAAPTRDTVVMLEGYTAANDGGHGAVVWDAASAVADDGGMVFEPDSAPAAGRWKRLTNWDVTPEKFATLQAAFDGARTYEKTLVLAPKKTYVLTNSITDAGVDILGNHARFDMSGLGAADYGLRAEGSAGTAVLLTVNAAATATSITVADTTGLAVGDRLWLSSTTVFATAEGVKNGQWIRVRSLPGAGVVDLYAPLAYAFTTAASASIRKPTLLDPFTWRDFTIIGSGADDQNGALLENTFGACLLNVSTDLCNARGMAIARSIGTSVRGGMFQRANRAGISYGIIIYNGCEAVTVDGVVGHDLRHLVTIGGIEGVNRAISVSNSKAFASRDAGFDCHSAGDGIQFSNLFVECGATAVDGAVMQGINYTVEGLDVRNVARNGLLAQWLPSAVGTASIRNVRGAATQALVSVEANGGDINSLTVDDIQGYGDVYQVLVQAQAGRYIRKATTRSVKSTSLLASRGIRYHANGVGAVISGGSISDVQIAMGGAALEAIYLHGNTGTVEGITVDELRVSGGSNNLRLSGANDCVLGTKHNFSGATSAMISWGSGTGNRGGCFTGSATYDPPNLAAGATQTTTVTVTGAFVGDAVTGVSFSVANAGITWSGTVTATNTVTVTMRNNTGGAIDLASGTLAVTTAKVV